MKCKECGQKTEDLVPAYTIEQLSTILLCKPANGTIMLTSKQGARIHAMIVLLYGHMHQVVFDNQRQIAKQQKHIKQIFGESK